MEKLKIRGLIAKLKRHSIIILFFISIFTSLFSYGQQLDPFCQNISSGTSETRSLLLDWNIGESLSTVTCQSSTSLLLTCGFLQNKNDALAIYKNMDSFKLNILIGPNPIQNNFTITCSQEGIDVLQIKIIDAFGICLQEINGPYSGLNFKKQFRLNSESTGVYYVIIHYLIGGIVNGYKISKLLKI